MSDLEKAMIKHYFDNVCAKLTLMMVIRHTIPCTCDIYESKVTVYCADPQYKSNTKYSYSDDRVSVELRYWNKLTTGADITIRYNTLDDLIANSRHCMAKLKLLLDMSHRDLYARNTQEERA